METWRDIPGYEGIYEASSEGRIRSKLGKTTSSARFAKRVWKQRIMRQSDKYGHNGKRVDKMVTLWKNGKPRKVLVARVVASAFYGNDINTKLTVNHIDGNTLNNNASNLEWVTKAENIRKGFDTGLYSNSCKHIEIEDKHKKIYLFNSYANTDRFLGQYSGYTSRAIILNITELKSKSGENFMIRRAADA